MQISLHIQFQLETFPVYLKLNNYKFSEILDENNDGCYSMSRLVENIKDILNAIPKNSKFFDIGKHFIFIIGFLILNL